MIDLTRKELPNTVDVGGNSFLIKTDFREWIKFGSIFKPGVHLTELIFVFDKKIPQDDFSVPLLMFYSNPNATPIPSSNKDDDDEITIIDYMRDGEYIYSAFMQSYGIDLVDIEYLHWHKFLALLRSISDDCKLSQIMGYRSYQKSNKTEEQRYSELRDIWTLPDEEKKKRNQSILEEFNKL